MRMVQIIATVLGLIESTCIMEEVKVTFATAGTTGMNKSELRQTLWTGTSL